MRFIVFNNIGNKTINKVQEVYNWKKIKHDLQKQIDDYIKITEGKEGKPAKNWKEIIINKAECYAERAWRDK